MNYSAYAFLKIRHDASPQEIMQTCEEYCKRWNMKDIRTQLSTLMSSEEAATVAIQVYQEGNKYIRSMASMLLNPSARQCYDAWLKARDPTSSAEHRRLTKARISWFNQCGHQIAFSPDMLDDIGKSRQVEIKQTNKEHTMSTQPKCRQCQKSFDFKGDYLVLHCHCTTRVGHTECMHAFASSCKLGKCPVCRQILLKRRQVSKYLFWNVKQKFKIIA